MFFSFTHVWQVSLRDLARIKFNCHLKNILLIATLKILWTHSYVNDFKNLFVIKYVKYCIALKSKDIVHGVLWILWEQGK